MDSWLLWQIVRDWPWVVFVLVVAPVLICASRAAGRGHCPVAFGLCGLTLSWGAVPVVWLATRGRLPDWDLRHRRLAEGRVDAGMQLLLAACLSVCALGALFPIRVVEDGIWEPVWIPLAAGYAFLPGIVWLTRFRLSSWSKPLVVAARQQSILQRLELEEVAAAAATIRVGMVFTFVLTAWTGLCLKFGLWSALLPLTG